MHSGGAGFQSRIQGVITLTTILGGLLVAAPAVAEEDPYVQAGELTSALSTAGANA